MQKRPLFTETVKATAAISANRFVTYAGKQAETAGELVMGVSDTAIEAGGYVGVDVIGTTIVDVGGTFSKGDDLAADTDGKAVKATAGQNVCARALYDAAAGQKTEVLLIQQAAATAPSGS
jgi:hypothetical protein|nr:MAG TPA: capsid fiber protein [Caudoviricetes sp.]